MEKLFQHEFDSDRMIMHMYFPDQKDVGTKQELSDHFELNHQLFRKYKRFGKFYLVIGIGNLLIDTALSDAYAEEASRLMKEYIIPGGVARYGFKMTRVTVKLGYEKRLKEDPNLFGSKEQAFAHIESLISKAEIDDANFATPNQKL